jgi:hypothetical protein
MALICKACSCSMVKELCSRFVAISSGMFHRIHVQLRHRMELILMKISRLHSIVRLYTAAYLKLCVFSKPTRP